jgi:hypothetical protein
MNANLFKSALTLHAARRTPHWGRTALTISLHVVAYTKYAVCT